MSAILSPCGTYRYQLQRTWGEGRRVAFIGVNPSTADATTDDHTVRKWRGFASRWGFDGFVVGNLFAYRSTNVRMLALAEDPVGPDNDHHLRTMLAAADLVVPCWGSLEKVPGWKAKQLMRDRSEAVRGLLRESGLPVQVLGLTVQGDPLHPLTLGYETKLRDWS